ncbi:MAG: hypothetical protein PHS42_03675 [Sulfurimonas sp.]|nr:hypothetical protein [Sulfurimonas sp.]MDD3834552.1 hypothetical protein [Sulfurimonas sp.]
MQKHMRVANFAKAVQDFRKINEAGSVQEFKRYLDANGLKIDRNDMLKELYIVGKQVQEAQRNNKENEMENNEEKIKLKKIDHCTYAGPDNKTYILLNSGKLKEAPLEYNRETIKQQKMKNRLLGIGVVMVLLMAGWNELHGKCIKGNMQELKQAQIEVRNTAIPKSLGYCSGRLKKPLEEEVERIIKKFEDQKYWLQLYRTEMEVSRGLISKVFIFWHHDYTVIKNGKRVLCVPDGTK